MSILAAATKGLCGTPGCSTKICLFQYNDDDDHPEVPRQLTADGAADLGLFLLQQNEPFKKETEQTGPI